MSIKTRVDKLEKKHSVEKIMISYDHALRITQHYLVATRDMVPDEALTAAKEVMQQRIQKF